MAQQTFTTVSMSSGKEDTVLLYTYATHKYRANESAGTGAFKITGLGAGTLQLQQGAIGQWYTLTTADITAGVWWDVTGFTIGSTSYPYPTGGSNQLRYTPPVDVIGSVTICTMRASSATGIDADLSSTDVPVRVNLAAVADLGVVTVSGAVALDQILTATTTDADGIASAISYTWQVNVGTLSTPIWMDIPNATTNAFTPTHAELGKYIRVRASYTDSLSTAEVVYSVNLFVSCAVQALRVWSGTAWVDATAVQYYNGVNWVDLNLNSFRVVA